MSAKKRKGVPTWTACDLCNVIISQKNEITHKEKNCPPNLQNWDHSFILSETLYTRLQTCPIDEKSLELFPKEDRQDFVLFPCHVLQLCKIPVGDFVTVTFLKDKNFVQIVKKAWTKQENTSDFSLALYQEVVELYGLEPKSQITVSKFKKNIPPAKTVTLICVKGNIPDKKILLSRLRNQNLNKVFYMGNNLLIKHYGNKIVFQIVEMTSLTEDENEDENCCFTSDETIWHLKEKDEEKKGKYESGDLIKKLGGLDSVISDLKEVMSLALSPNTKILSGLKISRGILIYGPPGTGKSSLLEALAGDLGKNIVRIECTKILSKFVGETEKELQNLFHKAKQQSPSIVLMDDLDALCSKSNSLSEFEKRIVATLCTLMDKLKAEPEKPVLVLAATSRIHQIDKMLRCPNRFGKEIEIYVPGPVQRFQILKLLLDYLNHDLDEIDIKNIAGSSHGFVGADLVSLVSKAVLKNYKNNQGMKKVSVVDFEWALGKVKPSALKEIVLDVPNVRWDDIGGQEELKLKLKQCVEWPLKYRDAFTRLALTPPKGVLMFGPPGCSKTMIAKALATESKLNFLSVKGPELFNKWVGESEKAVRKVFRRARQAAPSIIFFDELDAMGGERNASSNGSNVQERVLAQLLTELDGVESLENVTVIGATNRLDRIDPALIRPGRLDRIIYVPLPDRETRLDILRLNLSKTRIAPDVLVEELADKTEGYSGAEIVAVAREAALKALEENINAEMIFRKHFMEALSIILPRTPKSLLDMYDKYLSK